MHHLLLSLSFCARHWLIIAVNSPAWTLGLVTFLAGFLDLSDLIVGLHPSLKTGRTLTSQAKVDGRKASSYLLSYAVAINEQSKIPIIDSSLHWPAISCFDHFPAKRLLPDWPDHSHLIRGSEDT